MSQSPQELGLDQLRESLNAEWQEKWQDRYEQLGQLTRADFFLELTRLANDVFRESEMYRDGRMILGPDRMSDVLAAVTSDNYNNIDPMLQTADYKNVLAVARSKEELKREIVIDFLDKGETLGLNEEEQVVVRGFLTMASIMDDIAEKWRDDVVWSDTGRNIHALIDTEKMKLPETLANLGLAHSYAILRPGDNANFEKLVNGEADHGYVEVSQMEMFDSDYRRLSAVIGNILYNLGNIPVSSEANYRYSEYFSVWKQLCDSRNAEEANSIANELDRQWMLLPDDLLVTHPMEYGYYGEDGIRKDMYARLDLKDPTKQSLIDSCNSQRDEVYNYLRNHPNAIDKSKLLGRLDSLKQTRFLALAPITITMGFDFKTAAESLPNSDHQEVTDELGKRILVFLDGCANSWRRRVETWKIVYAGTSYEHLLDDINVEDWIIYNVATHESGETVSRDKETENRMGYRLVSEINENKSDVSGLAYLGERAMRSELSRETMEKLAKLELASVLFYLSRWGIPQVEPYHKGGIITANLAIETGLLYRNVDNEWVPDVTKARNFLGALSAFFWEHQVPVWESLDPATARAQKANLIDPYLEVSLGVDALLRVVSPRYNKAHT